MEKTFSQKLGRYLIQIVISSFAVAIAAWLLSGVHIGEPQYITAIIVAVVLSFLNSFIKPVLLFFSIPLTIFTLGLFLLVINAIIILIAGNIVEEFKVDGFWWAVAFSVILSITTSILEALGNTKVIRVEKDENDDLNNQEF